MKRKINNSSRYLNNETPSIKDGVFSLKKVVSISYIFDDRGVAKEGVYDTG